MACQFSTKQTSRRASVLLALRFFTTTELGKDMLISLLIGLLVLVLVVYVAVWLIGLIGLPAPANRIAVAIVAIIALLVVTRYVVAFGYGSSLHL